jgi:hypothetical protein
MQIQQDKKNAVFLVYIRTSEAHHHKHSWYDNNRNHGPEDIDRKNLRFGAHKSSRRRRRRQPGQEPRTGAFRWRENNTLNP